MIALIYPIRVSPLWGFKLLKSAFCYKAAAHVFDLAGLPELKKIYKIVNFYYNHKGCNEFPLSKGGGRKPGDFFISQITKINYNHKGFRGQEYAGRKPHAFTSSRPPEADTLLLKEKENTFQIVNFYYNHAASPLCPYFSVRTFPLSMLMERGGFRIAKAGVRLYLSKTLIFTTAMRAPPPSPS